MRNPTKIRKAALAAALAAVTATAFAMSASEEAQLNASANDGMVVAEHSVYLEPNETLVEESPPVVTQEAVPVVERPAAQPPVTVEERRLTLDERIQGDVMDAIYNMPNINGKIGVESRDAVVTLTGYTTTRGQAWRAGAAAGKISGVRYVNNEIRPRIGGSV